VIKLILTALKPEKGVREMLTREEIINIIEESADKAPYNNFRVIDMKELPMWEKPIVGFAKGDDPYFEYYKQTIGDFYWLPKEVYNLKYSDETIDDSQLTVISIGFPQTKETKQEQRKALEMPSDRWLYTRGEWEEMIGKITEDIVTQLESDGMKAVSLDSIKEFSRHISEKFGIASNWSHRHTAFIAGLGTFGLSDGLITKKGKAMRFTSLIVKGRIEPTKREYKDHHEYCKFYKDGSCGACIVRCPVDAISKDGHDKEKCSAFLQKIKNEIGPDFVKNSHYISGCGICQSKVPCQDGVPK
jgi:epoxyqueuosine reductase QueG